MNKYPMLGLIVLLAVGCTSIHRLDSNKYQVISVPEGLRESTNFAEVAHNLTNGIPVVFKFAAGEQMPLKLAVAIPMGTMEKSDCKFIFKRDTYLFLAKKKFLLSPDGQRWASITNPKSLAKLFG